MENIEYIKSIYKQYKKNPQLRQRVLDEAYVSKQTDVWSVIFEADKKLAKEIRVLETKKLAEQSLKDYSLQSLKAIADLAKISSEEDGKIILEKEKVWLSVFSGVPEFAPAFRERKEYWNNFEKEIISNIQGKKEDRNIVESYVIEVPLLVTKNSYLSDDIPPQNLVDTLTAHFNDFQLQGYMDAPHVLKSSLFLDNNHWQFNFDCDKQLTEIEKSFLLNQLKGQLSDGWGESMEQQTELVDANEISLGFDYKKANYTKSKKLKIKF